MYQQIPASALQDPAFLQQPALVPPPGVIPNFVNPEDEGPTLVVVGAILLALVVIALANRAYTKLCIVHKVSWDDLTISLSAVGAIVWYSICAWHIRKGIIGKHQYDVRVGEVLNNSFIIPSYLILVLNGPTLWVTKLTFFLLYLQIFRPIKWLRICIYSGVILSTVFYWSLSITLFVVGSPRGQTWAESYMSTPFITDIVNIAIAAGGLLIDVWLFILPLAAISTLQLQSSRKFGLAIMFSTGLIAVTASAVSIYFRCKLKIVDDKTWTGQYVELLYLIELDAGIITACMPSFAKMLHHHLPPWASLKSRLRFEFPASFRKGSKRDLITDCKRSRSIDFFDDENHRQGNNRLYTNDTHAGAEIELESQRSADNYSGYTAPDTFDDDRIFLKQHHPQQA